jgi:hypothetical protein
VLELVKTALLTCKMSSKCLATFCRTSDTLVGKRRIAPLPKEGIERKLWDAVLTLEICSHHNSQMTYRSLRTTIHSGFIAYSSLIRCLKTDLNTPSSNSCKRSTTSIEKQSKPRGPNRSAKAFCE